MTPTFRTSQPGLAVDPSKPHVILVGLPGAGKTTVGRAVAEKLARPFLDLDEEIERRESRSISQIFAESGEPYFREKERLLTEELREVGHMVLAPGGGWVGNLEVVALLRPPGRMIYLKTSPELALKRLGADRVSRPLLTRPDPLAEIKRLLAARKAAYESADHSVDTDRRSLQKVVDEVTQLAMRAV
jgi:shikimate kinase